MPIIPPQKYRPLLRQDGTHVLSLSKLDFEAFDARILGLGDITKASSTTDSIAAVFDLQGFTNFCRQIEPHLSVPLFLNSYLQWMTARLRQESLAEEAGRDVLLYAELPYFVKFLGDGLLVLWDSSKLSDAMACNVVVACHEICHSYKHEFLPRLGTSVPNPPSLLRCGVARGNVFSVGNGNDYVGTCINLAARLQKLPGYFAFAARGFAVDGADVSPTLRQFTSIKKVSIRGIGDEWVYLHNWGLGNLTPQEAALLG